MHKLREIFMSKTADTKRINATMLQEINLT